MSNYQLLGWMLLGAIAIVAIGAVWLGCIIIGELYDLKQSIKNVQCAYGNIEIEINKYLKDHNALHYSELLGIIKKVNELVPSVNITLERIFENNHIEILIESDGVKFKLSFISNVIEYGIPKLNNSI